MVQGDLIGGGADFVQKICLEKFGIQVLKVENNPIITPLLVVLI